MSEEGERCGERCDDIYCPYVLFPSHLEKWDKAKADLTSCSFSNHDHDQLATTRNSQLTYKSKGSVTSQPNITDLNNKIKK